MWLILLGIFAVVCVGIVVFLCVYSNPMRNKWYVIICTAIALFLSLSIVGIIPVDIASVRDMSNCLTDK